VFSPAFQLASFIEVELKPDWEKKKDKLIAAIVGTSVETQPPYFTKPCAGILEQSNRLANTSVPASLELIIGFSKKTWIILSGCTLDQMGDFNEMVSADGKHKFPATHGDVFFHIKGNDQGIIEKLLDQIHVSLDVDNPDTFVGKLTLQRAFNNSDGRNEMGFFDAGSDPSKTQNPTLVVGPIVKTSGENPVAWDLGKIATTLIGDEDIKNKNGSYAIVQNFKILLKLFNHLDEDKQSQVIGREKSGGGLYGIKAGVLPLGGFLNHELPDAHIIRTHVRTGPHGKESTIPAQIYRQGGSWKNGQDVGLFFAAYCRYTHTFDRILQQMIGKTGSVLADNNPHSVDALMNYITALTGQYYYIPSLGQLYALNHYQ